MTTLISMALTVELLAGAVSISGGVMSGANSGVLEGVAARRQLNGWCLPADIAPADYDVLVATPECSCEQVGRSGVLIVDGIEYTALVVDCAQPIHERQMKQAGLLADVNDKRLWHKIGILALYE